MKKLLILTILVIIITSCAKRNTAYQQENYLELKTQIPLIGNPKDIFISDATLYVAEDQCGISIINLSSYEKKWYTNIHCDSGEVIQLRQIKKIHGISSLNKIFINEVANSDGIFMVHAVSDTLKFDTMTIGGTQNITDMKFYPSNNGLSGFTSENTTIHYSTYDETANLWSGYLKNYESPINIKGFDLTDQYIYAAIGQMGLIIFDRNTGSIISQLDLPGEAQKIKVLNGYAYVACQESGLQIIDVSNISIPILVGEYETEGYATSIDVYNNLAIISSGGGGVYLFDISNPNKPTLKQNIRECGYTNSAKFYNNNVVIAGRNSGISIYSH